jgi:hypothetical protein
MRAATPVGAGTSTQFTENETKTLGTAYDDQMQGHDILGGVPMPNGLSNHTIYGVSSQGTPGLATFVWRVTPHLGRLNKQDRQVLSLTDQTEPQEQEGNYTR